MKKIVIALALMIGFAACLVAFASCESIETPIGGFDSEGREDYSSDIYRNRDCYINGTRYVLISDWLYNEGVFSEPLTLSEDSTVESLLGEETIVFENPKDERGLFLQPLTATSLNEDKGMLIRCEAPIPDREFDKVAAYYCMGYSYSKGDSLYDEIENALSGEPLTREYFTALEESQDDSLNVYSNKFAVTDIPIYVEYEQYEGAWYLPDTMTICEMYGKSYLYAEYGIYGPMEIDFDDIPYRPFLRTSTTSIVNNTIDVNGIRYRLCGINMSYSNFSHSNAFENDEPYHIIGTCLYPYKDGGYKTVSIVKSSDGLFTWLDTDASISIGALWDFPYPDRAINRFMKFKDPGCKILLIPEDEAGLSIMTDVPQEIRLLPQMQHFSSSTFSLEQGYQFTPEEAAKIVKICNENNTVDMPNEYEYIGDLYSVYYLGIVKVRFDVGKPIVYSNKNFEIAELSVIKTSNGYFICDLHNKKVYGKIILDLPDDYFDSWTTIEVSEP